MPDARQRRTEGIITGEQENRRAGEQENRRMGNLELRIFDSSPTVRNFSFSLSDFRDKMDWRI